MISVCTAFARLADGAAFPEVDVDAGGAYAKQVCAACHAVDAAGTSHVVWQDRTAFTERPEGGNPAGVVLDARAQAWVAR